MASLVSAAAPPHPVVVEIPGRAFRRYRVRDLAEVDACLRQLKVWLADAIARSPALTRRHIARYLWDCDRLLDVRSRLMALDQG
jgi:hypothetical protein